MSTAEYRLPSAIDPDVLGDRETEIWAQVWRPKALAANHPVLVFLHGNHGTCGKGSSPRVDDNAQYTGSGSCPPGYRVTPNHMGYAYLAEKLAAWGYVVVSINANRGITSGGSAPGDSGLNLARGRLVLKHLALLSAWNSGATATPATLGASFKGALDFGNVGLLGHSRGGEGVRAALAQYTDPASPWPARIKALTVKGIFEIGPVDGQTSRVLDAKNAAWNVVLPMCDGDVSNLQGMRPFDRMMTANNETTPKPKSMFAVWGTNHNFFNTEWQTSDSQRCGGTGHKPIFAPQGQVGSEAQRSTGIYGAMAFFRGNVGAKADPRLAQLLDANFALPPALRSITPIERTFTEAANEVFSKNLEDFATGSLVGKSGVPFKVEGTNPQFGAVLEHDKLQAATLSWGAQGSFQINMAAAGVDVSAYKTFELRASLADRTSSPPVPVTFGVQLLDAAGGASPVRSSADYIDLQNYGGHEVLGSMRIPLAEFSGVDLHKLAGVRLVFGVVANEKIMIAGVRVSKPVAVSPSFPIVDHLVAPSGFNPEPGTQVIAGGNQIERVVATPAGVEVHLHSDATFHVADELAVLQVGNEMASSSRYVDGETSRLVFTMGRDEFARVQNGAPVTVQYGTLRPTHRWVFGAIDTGHVE